MIFGFQVKKYSDDTNKNLELLITFNAVEKSDIGYILATMF